MARRIRTADGTVIPTRLEQKLGVTTPMGRFGARVREVGEQIRDEIKNPNYTAAERRGHLFAFGIGVTGMFAAWAGDDSATDQMREKLLNPTVPNGICIEATPEQLARVANPADGTVRITIGMGGTSFEGQLKAPTCAEQRAEYEAALQAKKDFESKSWLGQEFYLHTSTDKAVWSWYTIGLCGFLYPPVAIWSEMRENKTAREKRKDGVASMGDDPALRALFNDLWRYPGQLLNKSCEELRTMVSQKIEKQGLHVDDAGMANFCALVSSPEFKEATAMLQNGINELKATRRAPENGQKRTRAQRDQAYVLAHAKIDTAHGKLIALIPQYMDGKSLIAELNQFHNQPETLFAGRGMGAATSETASVEHK